MNRWFANDRCQMLAVLGLCLGADISAGLAASPCAQENKTTVCRSEGRTIRVIAETSPPSARYAIGWIVPAVAATEFERNPEDGSLVLPSGEPENVIVRLGDGAIIAHTGSTHFGDHSIYNHAELAARWSKDETRLLMWQNDKWDTLSAEIFRLDKTGKLSAHGDLLAIVRRLSRQHLARRKRVGAIDAYEAHIVAARFDRGNRMEIKTVLQIPGTDDPGFYFKMKVRMDKAEIRVIDMGALRR